MDTQSRKFHIEEGLYEVDDSGVDLNSQPQIHINNSFSNKIEMDIAWFNAIESLFTDLKKYVNDQNIPILNTSNASAHFISEFYPLFDGKH